MSDAHSDALVFFGATGDLAYKKIFPALQAMVKRGHLDVPVIGVAKAGWNLDQLKARARDSLEKHGGARRRGVRQALRPAALRRRRLQRPGDVRRHPQRARRRRSIRPTTSPFRRCCSGRWSSSSAKSGCAEGRARHRREAVRPRPRLGARAQSNPARRASTRSRSSASTTTSASGRCRTCCSSASRTRSSSRSGTATYVESVQITMAENFGVQGRGAFYDQTGTIRDVVQNHLFQVLANLAMEPPVARPTASRSATRR